MSKAHSSRRCLAGIVVLALCGTAPADSSIELRDYCPPGFELIESNACELRTLYQNYDSLRYAGVGGPRTGLPEARDGFSPQQIDLGRYLFFDPLLSGDDTISCASCHHPDLGFADGRPRSIGIDGTEVSRAAPSLWNVAFLGTFFWDARANSLEEQMQGPLYDAREMGSNPAQLLADIGANDNYARPSLISLNSRYDQYAHGFHDALTEQEKEGMNVFRSFVARCAECHTPPLFTNQQIAVIGVREPSGRDFDPGAEVVFENPGLRGGFKVPSLRNVARTAPYMHSGTFATLREAAEFYTLGRGHALPEQEQERVTVHWHIWEPDLADAELDRLVDFLGALTDERFRPEVPETVPSGLLPVGALPEALTTQASRSKQNM
jgi:cytochrome c peroxidase